MRDISAGGDIVNSTITEIVGNNPSVEILQQPAQELAEAERGSRRIVRFERRRRARRAAIFGGVALAAFGAAGVLGYFWLFQGGELSFNDLVHDGSNIAIAALISTLVAAIAGVVTTALSIRQKTPRAAETLNVERLATITLRWDELRALGLSKAEIKALRKRR
ncbi:hypothetical protein [Microbacterium sp. ZW T5_56]|uniref:hypothetical protein n=1 Tax=Microbacterium sp. ZW T5_56 TaxID=3378081 RepID=UPI003852A7DF